MKVIDLLSKVFSKLVLIINKINLTNFGNWLIWKNHMNGDGKEAFFV